MKKALGLMLTLIMILVIALTLTACGDGVPSAPQNLTVTVGDKQVTLTWSAPTNDGGSEITGYAVYIENCALSHTTATSYTFFEMQNGIEQTFYVYAINKNGSGADAKIKGTPGSGNNSNLEGRIISGKYSIIVPEGWQIKNTQYEGEAKLLGTDSFIQITTMGMSAADYFRLMNVDEIENIKMGGYTFKTGGTNLGTVMYVYEDGNKSVLITVYKVDTKDIENALKSFRIS